MRLPNSNRGAHPNVRDSSVCHYGLDDNDINEAHDLTSVSAPLVTGLGAPLPPIIDAPIGVTGRRFDGSSALFRTGDAFTDGVFTGDITVHMWIRLNSVPSPASLGASVAYTYGGDIDSETSTENILFRLGFTDDLKVQTFWEYGGGSNEINESPFFVPVNEWFMITVRRVDTGGTSDLAFGYNGQMFDPATGVPNPTSGSGSNHVLGGQEATGAIDAGIDADIAGLYIHNAPLSDGDIITDFRNGMLLPFYTHVDARVFVEDHSGDMRDMTCVEGYDWVDDIDVSGGIDNSILKGRVNLLREVGELSLAALNTRSKLNLTDFADPESFVPFLDLGRDIEVKAATVPLGMQATDQQLQSIIFGSIDSLDWSSGEAVAVHFRDQGGRLIDTYIEELAPYAAGQPAESLQTVLQNILDANDSGTFTGSYDPITLSAPVDPNWTLLTQENGQDLLQRREPVMTALRTLAGQIGWDVRYLYNDATESWELTLFEPDRTQITPDITIAEEDVINATQLEISIQDTRPVWRVTFPHSGTSSDSPPSAASGTTQTHAAAGVDHRGQRNPAWIKIEDDAALAKYGRRFAEVNEANVRAIDTFVEAQRFCLALLSDTAEPDLTHSLTLPLTWRIEVNDMLGIEEVREFYTGAQTLAVSSFRHNFGSTATTTVGLRGKPSVGFKRWLKVEARPGQARPPVISPVDSLQDRTIGQLIPLVSGILNRSDYLTGGRQPQVRNHNFSQSFRGDAFPPDGWEMITGTWGTDIEEELSPTLTVSGGRSLKWNGSAEIRSDLIPITGGNAPGHTVPYAVEAIVRQTDTLPSNHIITVHSYDENRNQLPGSFTFEPFLNGQINEWLTMRMGSVTNFAFLLPPVFVVAFASQARFATITLNAPDSPPSYIDSVSLMRVGYDGRAGRDDNTDSVANNTFVNIPLDAPILSFGGTYDSVSDLFEIQESGPYKITAKVRGLKTGGGTLIQVRPRITINGTTHYDGPGSDLVQTAAGDDFIDTEMTVSLNLSRDDTVQMQGLIQTTIGGGGGGPDRFFPGDNIGFFSPNQLYIEQMGF